MYSHSSVSAEVPFIPEVLARQDIAPAQPWPLVQISQDWLMSLAFPLFLMALWQLSTLQGWISPQVLPAPADVARALWDLLISGDIGANLKVSMSRVLTGFGLGAAAGLALGVALGLSPAFSAYVYPSFKALSQIPVIGWLPFLMLLVGIDEGLKYLLIAKAALVPVAVNTCQGIQGVPNTYVEVARTYGFSRWQLLRRVVLPAATVQIWTGLRYGFTHAWLALVVVELLASSEGIGFMIVYGRQLFQLDVVLAAVVVVGAIGLAIDRIFERAQAYVLRWRPVGL